MRSFWVVVLGVVVSGCLSSPSSDEEEKGDVIDDGLTPVTDVWTRANLPFQVGGDFSRTLLNGTFKILDALSVYVEVAVPLGNGLPTQRAHMGVFLPDVPEGTKVPIVADVGPYYGDGDVDATTPAGRLGRFLIENFVPHGYAVAQISVLGTGKSNGCMDLMGEVEQAGIQAAVEWLATQSWSNGNVALIGRSYDGSTPWEAVMGGSEHVKTIVPISGLFGQYELMWRNGSAESRGPGLLWAIYYVDAYTGEDDAALQAEQAVTNTICPESTGGGAVHASTYVTGDGTPAFTPYWQERSFKAEALQNYKGSVYFIHGLQDWNVDPHMAFPFYNELEAKGLEMKGLFGQWGHMYPDRPNEHSNLRWDWAQDLLEWFDHYLKGTGKQPALHVEVQSDDKTWRVEDTWPPANSTTVAWKLGADLKQTSDGEPLVSPVQRVTLLSEPLDEDTRIVGLPQLHVAVTPLGPGGQLYAELRDADDGRRIGHAIMDLRFAEGGYAAQPVVPGMPLVARMEFEPLDAFVPKGHALQLHIASTGRDYLPSAVSTPVLVDVSDASELRFLTTQPSEDSFFMPPGTTPEATTPIGR